MNKIKDDIKNKTFEHVYLIMGEEKFTRRNVKKILCNAIVSSDDTMNFNSYEGKGINPNEVIDLAETLPFFAERRLILMENTGYFKNACEIINKYINDIPDTTYFVFVEDEVDKRSSLYKSIKKKGYVVECNHLKNNEIMNWILGRLGKEHKNITRQTMDYLIGVLGNDMEKISNEVEKLLSYTLNKDIIEISDIDAICVPEVTDRIFDMIEAMGNKNKDKALELYYDLILKREAPMKILYMLSRQFSIMLRIKDLAAKGVPAVEIESKTGIQGFVVKKTVRQLKNFSRKDIREAMEKSIAIEEAVKRGDMTDKIAAELMIIEFSS